jgi:aspartokinase-like uncharacterized kinase
MWVVKVGGSLFSGESLPGWLAALTRHGRGRVVIVPGGGPFADQVRAAQARWRFGDAVAHHMAMLGMAQYGLMLSGLEPALVAASGEDAIRLAWRQRMVPIWTPYGASIPDVRADWSMTSDSLAAWLAARLQIKHLLLVKSVRIDTASIAADELARRGVIDLRLPELLRGARLACRILAAQDYDLFESALRGEPAGAAVTATLSGTAGG